MSEPNPFPDEQVLSIATEDIYAKIGAWRGLRKPESSIWQVIAKKSNFRPRTLLESDPLYKQLVSYTLFVSGKRIFVMKRLNAQGEKRLRGLLSVGVGGHMNPVGDVKWPGKRRIGDIKNLVGMNTVREIREEVITAKEPQINIVGFLNDDSNEVGQVHLGIVSVVHLPSPLLAIKETDKMSGSWIELSKLNKLGSFETWSSLVLQGLV